MEVQKENDSIAKDWIKTAIKKDLPIIIKKHTPQDERQT